jgi:putative ABC transport system permease protein
VLGTVVAALILPSLTDGSHTGYPGFHIRFDLLSLAAVSGAIIGAIVSVIPAFAAAKVDVLNTLRGVRRNAKVRTRSGVGGLVVIAIGIGVAMACTIARTYIESDQHSSDVGWLLLGIGIGAIITVIGLLVASPWLLVAARFLFRRISPASNYATNDLIYNRKRYTAVIASVLATAFVGSSVLTLLFSFSEALRAEYRPNGEINQLVIDHSGYAVISGSVPMANTKTELERVITQNKVKLASNLSAAKEIAETKSAGLINVHEQYAQFGYGLKPAGPVFGFEGQQPYLMRDPNYFCPYSEASPIYAKFNELQQSQQWDAVGKIENDPKYVRCETTMLEPSRFMVGTAADLRVLLGGRIDAAAEKALAQGGAVVFHPGLMRNGKAILNWYPSGIDALLQVGYLNDAQGKPVVGDDGKPLSADHPTKTEAIPAVLSSTPSYQVTMMLSQAKADELGISYSPWMMVANFKQAVTTAQHDQLNQAFNGEFTLEQGYGFDTEAAAWWVTLAVGFFILASTTIALGLAQIESRADQSTLGSIGAPKRFRATVVSSQALVLTLLGTVLGSSVGLLFAWAMFPSMKPTSTPVDLMIPPVQAAVMILGIPLVASAIFWFATPRTAKYRTRLAIE